MSKIHSKDEYLRKEKAFHLMSLSASASSNSAFAQQVDSLGFKLLPEYSHGDLSKPRFCCTTVQNKENLKEVFWLFDSLRCFYIFTSFMSFKKL